MALLYAVIKTGGQQFRVEQGTTLKIEKLEVEPGKSITFEDVLMVADGDKVEIGAPLVAKASVEAKLRLTLRKHQKLPKTLLIMSKVAFTKVQFSTVLS
jgi:ribosomal protein L21